MVLKDAAEADKDAEAKRQVFIEQVKNGRRVSTPFNSNWQAHCDKNGRGLYDPSRHSLTYLEEFIKANPVSGGKKRSRSKSWKPRTAESSSSRSASRSRKRKRRKDKDKKHRRRRKHHRRPRRRDRKRRKRRRKRSRSRSSSSGSEKSEDSTIPGLPSRAAAIKSAEAAVVEAKKVLLEAKAALAAGQDKRAKAVEGEHEAEVARRIDLEKKSAEDDMQVQLRQAQDKLGEEKATRMKEAEKKLDEAIAERLNDVRKQMQPHADARVEEARVQAEAKFKVAITNGASHPEPSKEAEDVILAAELRVRDARAHLASVQDGTTAKDKPTEKDADEYSRSSSRGRSSSSSRSKLKE
jgi:hypothetical protein